MAAGRTRVVVVGGGLAGITAALDCIDAGADVTVLESRGWLGGLTHSFRRHGLWVDNGQHVFLRCCTAYRGLLDRLGVANLVTLQDRLDVPVASGDSGQVSRLRRSGLPAPLHLGAALARYRWLEPAERLRAARAALGLKRIDVDDPATDKRSFGSWLGEHGQSPRSLEALWDLIGIATLNAPAAEASLALGAVVFQQGVLGSASAGDIGWANAPLRRLHGDAATDVLEREGAQVRTRARVRALRRHDDRWSVAVDGGSVEADAVVLAVPPVVAEDLLPEGTIGPDPGWSFRLGASPIVNLHVVYDRTVLSEPFLAAVDSPLQWVFDRTGPSGLQRGQYVAVSVSAADDLVDLPTAQVRDRLLPALSDLLPRADAARVEDVFVTRERQATFRCRPGTASIRPGAATGLPGLALAGAWTATGWPATMEGAVRSGHTAVAHLLSNPVRSGGARVQEVVA
jgi:squalene-associated FAD-dependent desaturase